MGQVCRRLGWGLGLGLGVGVGLEVGMGRRLGAVVRTESCNGVQSTYWGRGEGAVLLFRSRLRGILALQPVVPSGSGPLMRCPLYAWSDLVVEIPD